MKDHTHIYIAYTHRAQQSTLSNRELNRLEHKTPRKKQTNNQAAKQHYSAENTSKEKGFIKPSENTIQF